jgi:hypothetical protein
MMNLPEDKGILEVTEQLSLVLIRKDAEPAAFGEGAAANYIGMNRTDFRKKLLFAGIVPFTYHLDGKKRFFLKCDLDAYLAGLPRFRMTSSENSLVALKGAGK